MAGVRVTRLVSISLLTAGLHGCGPSDAEAGGEAEGPRVAPPSSIDSPANTKPNDSEDSVSVLRDVDPSKYVLPFEARSNPFAPPTPAPTDQTDLADSSDTSEMRLLGIMDSGSSRMATVALGDEHQIVMRGQQIIAQGGRFGPQVVDIRETDIVVEQGGRQWIVAMPRP